MAKERNIMGNREKRLTQCPLITRLVKLDLTRRIHLTKDKTEQEILKKRLEKTAAYRITYRTNALKVTGFIVFPKRGKKLPCIISLRGGSRDFGAIDEETIVNRFCRYAERGYVVITTQYPGVDGGEGADTWGGPDDMQSIKNLKAILEWCPQADTSQIGVRGHSRGGLMAYMLLREVKWIKAAVIGGAPSDEFRAGKERKGWRKHQVSLYGATRKELLKRSPIKWAAELPKNAPILLVHGSADWRVLADHSILMSAQLYKYHIPHRLIIFEGADHRIAEYREEYFEQSLQWFERFLKKDRKLPNLRLHGE